MGKRRVGYELPVCGSEIMGNKAKWGEELTRLTCCVIMVVADYNNV